MNICKCFKCNTCGTTIDCRIGMSNRNIQPFQFACPKCEERITFVFGATQDGSVSGATEEKMNGPFKGENPFIDLHLDFPAKVGKYEMGHTTFMRVVDEIGSDAYCHLNSRLNLLNYLYPKQPDLRTLIIQYRRGDIDNFATACTRIPNVTLTSNKEEDVIAALYSATSVMSSPFTIHEHNKELSQEFPHLYQSIYENHPMKFEEFFRKIVDNGFLRTLHHDCINLYPKIVALELPFRPAFYYDYHPTGNLGAVPTRVSIADFDTCNNLYKDLAEVFSRQLILLAGVNNLLKRGDFDTFDDSVRLNRRGVPVKEFASLDDYADVDLGRKIGAIDDAFYAIDSTAVDHKLRNSIAHFKYEYRESIQLIKYYPGKEGMERTKCHEIYFIEFMHKTLLLFREVHSLNHLIKTSFFFCIFRLGIKIEPAESTSSAGN